MHFRIKDNQKHFHMTQKQTLIGPNCFASIAFTTGMGHVLHPLPRNQHVESGHLACARLTIPE